MNYIKILIKGCEFMKTAAIIAEYNPFHNGHKFHIEKTRLFSDRVVVLMSGSFVQRGEAAIFSKWQRAESAVKNGADLVIELPCHYSVSSSRDFASGAVRILDALGCVDFLSFGSESGSPEMPEETEDFSRLLKAYQKEGLSYRAASEKAAAELNIALPENPNDLLGAEYIKALRRIKSSIVPVATERTVAHDSVKVSGFFASASRIRELISEGKDVSAFVPELPSEHPLFFSDLKSLIYLSVLNFDPELFSVRSLSDSELLNTIAKKQPEEDFMSHLYNIKSKRYAMSRVKRTLLHILLNSGEKIPDFAPYARVLALNNTGASILRDAKKSGIKIITKLKKSDLKENPGLALDVRASDIRSIALGEGAGRDFLTSPRKI